MTFAAVGVVLLLLVSACTSSVEPTTTLPATTTTPVPATTSIPATSTTTTSAPTTTTMTDPTFVSVAYSLEGSPRLRSMRHIEVFFYPPDILIDPFPVELLSEDYETPVDGSVFFGESVLPGMYEVRSFQRTCGESCDVLEPPSEGCATRMEAAPDTEVRVIVVDRPGTECAVVVEGGQTGEPERSMALTLEPQGGTGCDPASPVVGSGLPETLGTSSGVSVGWGLLWAQPPIPVGLLTKMVFRVTGDGPTEIAAIHDDGTEMVPQWCSTRERC